MNDLSILAALAYAITAGAYLARTDAQFKLAIAFCCALLGVYFFSLGMLFSSATMALASLRLVVTLWFSPSWLGLALIGAAIGLPLAINSTDYLGIAAFVAGTYGAFWCAGWRLRLAFASCSGLMVVNALLFGAHAAALGEAALTLVGLWSTLVHYRQEARARPALT